MTYIITIKRMKPMLKITDLVEGINLVDLQESEIKNKNGVSFMMGNELVDREDIRVINGLIQQCRDGILWTSDKWVVIGKA